MKYSTILTAGLASFASAKKSYDGYRTYRVSAANDAAGARAALDSINLDYWEDKLDTVGVVDVVIPPEQIASFEALGLSSTVMQEDLGAAIAAESAAPDLQTRQADGANYAQGYFDRYHSYYQHLQFLYSMADEFENNSVIFSAGTSYEGRPMMGIRIFGDGGGPNGDTSRPGMVFHSTVHAREWITTMVDEYIAYTMLSEYNVNPNITKYLNTADLYIIPIVNPDGFVFTQTEDRLWRKNRQPSGTRDPCVGTDENRNWPFEWDAADGAGSSTNPCSATYRGPFQASSPETQALVQHLGRVRDQQGLLLYIDWHSYSQLLMWPYGYSCNATVDNPEEYYQVGNATADAIEEVYGTLFETGPICNTIYQVAGGSVDWAYERGDATWSFTFELRDRGTFGFVLPPSQIYPSCVEAFAGIVEMLGQIVSLQ